MNKWIIDVNTVNKIKFESKEAVEGDSIFREVYKKAQCILNNIIKDNQNNSEPAFYEKISNKDEQIPNVISFLGERGRGKTSAMLSFLLYLEGLQMKPNDADQLFKKVKYSILPYIDAAVLAEREFVLDVILAKMWDAFDDYDKNTHNSQKDTHYMHLERNVRNGFASVRKAYLVLKAKEENRLEAEDYDAPAAGALHELSVSMNLRQELQTLVQDYIRLMNYNCRSRGEEEGYLVLVIDDLDMSGKKAQPILEQIRRFLNISGVIIFVTADIDRLKLVCESKNIEIYKPLDKMQALHMFVNDYLDKVLPSNMRIYMPELMENHNDIVVKKDVFHNWKEQLNNNTEKALILELMSKKCHINFDICRSKRHFLQNKSLRSMTNYFESLSQLEERDWYAWLKADLKDRLIERINDSEQRIFMRNLLTRDYEEMNKVLLSYLKLRYYPEMSISEKSLGRVLYSCSLVEEMDAGNIEFVNSILYFYSVILAQIDFMQTEAKKTDESKDDDRVINENENKNKEILMDKIIGSSLFDYWEYRAVSSQEDAVSQVLGFDNRSELILSGNILEKHIENLKPEHIKDFFINNEVKILGWLYTMLYVEVTQLTNQAYDFTAEIEYDGKNVLVDDNMEKSNDDHSRGKKVISLCFNTTAKKSCFGFMKKSRNEQQRLMNILKQVLNAVSKSIYDDYGINYEESRQELEKLFGEICDSWLSDIPCEPQRAFPVQNVEMLYSIGKAFENNFLRRAITSPIVMFEQMRRIYQMVESELQKRDDALKEISINTSYAQDFHDHIQVKIFADNECLTGRVKMYFIIYFYDLFRDTENKLTK